MQPRLTKLLTGGMIAFLSIGLAIAALCFPDTSLQKLIFFQDSLWVMSWLLIARESFLSRRSGFPPKAIPVTLGVELYLMFHYTVLFLWPSWLLINYILWPVTSLFNLTAILRFSRKELVEDETFWKCILKIAFETAAYFSLFSFIARFLPQHEVMAYLGQSTILAISVFFLLRILRNNDLTGMSFSGNLVRVLAGVICFYVNIAFRNHDLLQRPYLLMVMILSLFVDLVFCYFYFIKTMNKNLNQR